jgi:hypothetical protein
MGRGGLGSCHARASRRRCGCNEAARVDLSSLSAGRLVTMFIEEYWLQHCEGFRVRTPAGYEGFVEDVMLDRRRGRPERLSVRCNRRLLVVESAAVDLILPESETLVLRQPLPRRPRGAARAPTAPSRSRETTT